LTKLEVVAGGSVVGTFDRSAVTSIQIYGHEGDDTFTVDDSNGSPVPSGGITFDGGAGSDRLVGPNVTNTWSLSTADGGKLFTTGGTVFFSSVENLTGGSGTDAFKFSTASGSLTGNLDGGAGANRLEYAAVAGPVTVNLQTHTATSLGGTFANIGQLVGSAGSDTLVGANITNTWSLSSANGGKIFNSLGTFAFSSVENLVGGSGTDAFKLTTASGSLSGSIDGSTGANRLEYAGLAGPVTVNLETHTATSLGGTFANIGQLVGSAGVDTLVGADVTNTWSVSSAGGGKIFNSLGTFLFSSVENLMGGAGTDAFTFSGAGTVLGQIDGGGGTDWLDYSALSVGVTVDLNAQTASRVSGGIQNIRNVRGGSGDDNLTGNSLGNILVGGAGNDVLTGGAGRNLLIGGLGADTVTGGSADDILVGGTTDYDGSNQALIALFTEWLRTDKDYAGRIADLRTGGGINGSKTLVFGTTIHDDGSANTLSGLAGLDWFFAGALDSTDAQPGEKVNNQP
jgi:Ca2+-binding RTX toxin-like protein